MTDDEIETHYGTGEAGTDGAPEAGAADTSAPEPETAPGAETAPENEETLDETVAAGDNDGDAPVPGNEPEEVEGEGEEDAEDGPQLPLVSIVEAVLFAAREPLKAVQIARAVGKRTRQEVVRDAVAELNVQYLEAGRSFEIAEISGRFQLMSRPEFATHIMRIYPKRDLADKEKSQRLTPAALDTLAIIAYKQPVTRAEIERIRGVGCGPALRTLIERGSVRVAGKRTDLVGQPLVYGTTEAFLAEFGLGSLEELPLRGEFLGMLGVETGSVELAEPEAPAEAPDAEPTPETSAEEPGDETPETSPEETGDETPEENDEDAAAGDSEAEEQPEDEADEEVS